MISSPFLPLNFPDWKQLTTVWSGILSTFKTRSDLYIPKKGVTAERPKLSATDIGVTYMDTTLDPDGMPIWWNGLKWIKSDGTNA
jgi:hypothetical protein